MNPYAASNVEEPSVAPIQRPFRHLQADVPKLQRIVIALVAAMVTGTVVAAWAVFLARHINERFEPNMGLWVVPHFAMAILVACLVSPVTFWLACSIHQRIARPLYLSAIIPGLLSLSPGIQWIDHAFEERWNLIAFAFALAGVLATPSVCFGLFLCGCLSVVATPFVRHSRETLAGDRDSIDNENLDSRVP